MLDYIKYMFLLQKEAIFTYTHKILSKFQMCLPAPKDWKSLKHADSYVS